MVTLVSGCIGISVASLILYLVRKDRLHVKHGLGWVLIALTFAVVGLFPGIVDYIALRFGIAYPPVLALTIAVSLLVLKALLGDLERSRMDTQNQRLLQQVAILEAELRKIRDQLSSGFDK